MKLTLKFPKEEKGGPGSGHRGHAGRPGKRGGSSPGSGGSSPENSAEILAGDKSHVDPIVSEAKRIGEEYFGSEDDPGGLIWADPRDHFGDEMEIVSMKERLLEFSGGDEEDPDWPTQLVDEFEYQFIYNTATKKASPFQGYLDKGEQLTPSDIADFYKTASNNNEVIISWYGETPIEIIIP